MLKLDKSKLVTNLGKRYKLVPYLDKAIRDFEDPWTYQYEEKQGDDAWHPSGHCTLPVSTLYQIATGQAEEGDGPSLSLRKAFQVGHFWHQWLQYLVLNKLEFCDAESIERRGHKWWGDLVTPSFMAESPISEGSAYFKDKYRKEDAYYLRYPELIENGALKECIRSWPDDDLGVAKIKPQPFHWATGSGDIAPCVLPGDWEGIIDFKTMAGQQYKQANIPQWAAAKYECQVNIYMDFFDVEKAIIVAVCKDSPHEMKEFEYARNQDLIDAIYDKWKFVSEAIDEDLEVTTLEDDAWPELPITGPIG